jgi:hypothetical protein
VAGSTVAGSTVAGSTVAGSTVAGSTVAGYTAPAEHPGQRLLDLAGQVSAGVSALVGRAGPE